MTSPEVDHELERLFSVARQATVADAGARERIAAALAPRLASSAATAQSGWGRRAWLRLGLSLLGVGIVAVAFWLTSSPGTKTAVAPVLSRAPVSAAASLEPPAPAASAIAPEPAPLDIQATPVDATPSAPPHGSGKPTPSSARSADPAEELALVRAMQQALRAGNPGQALALAADHARRFPRGNLVEEREGVRAVAQCQSAAVAARPSILNAFLRTFATSPYAARVKAACQ